MKTKKQSASKNYCSDKLVFSPQLANYLLDCGYKIIRIKKNNSNGDASVFVFKGEPGLIEVIEEWIY